MLLSNRPELSPSFSAAKWTKCAQQFGLPRYVSLLEPLRLETFKTPTYHLLPSLHVAVFKNSWLWQEVYSKQLFREEGGLLRTLDPYMVPIVALFHGRVRDGLECTLLETTGSEVDHKFDLSVPDGNALTRLFLDLVSAAESNQGLRIYGLLTSLDWFKFYSYDPASNRIYVDKIYLSIAQKGHKHSLHDERSQ